MLKKFRIILAALFFIGVTLLFLDITGIAHLWLGWMAKVQFIPAFLAMNFGVVALLVILTLVFGRIYCSVICPLGIMQDIISWCHGKTKKKNRFRLGFKPAMNWLRYALLAVFIITLAAGANSVATLIAPYSSYGRIASNLFAPIYRAGNNVLAWIAERAGSYAFYTTDVWIKSMPTFIVAIATFIIIFAMSWKGGRTYCNTVCPVGTILGTVSRYSLFAPVIDTAKCRSCGLCGKQCKASCIDMKAHKIDYSRCVVCMDCISTCKEGAVKYKFRFGTKPGPKENYGADNGRRAFIASSAIATVSLTAKAQEMKTDGGLSIVRRPEIPERETHIVPAGSVSIRHFYTHCTTCQLCISACPNNVLRPSAALDTLMQPEMSYERGYCRPECTICSEVCPAGAIFKIGKEEKSSIQIGHAVVDLKLCVVNTDEVSCGNCARHCPAGAIRLVRKNPDDNDSLRIPTVNEERCIGCGACEHLCPARPLTAIHVEGHQVHRTV